MMKVPCMWSLRPFFSYKELIALYLRASSCFWLHYSLITVTISPLSFLILTAEVCMILHLPKSARSLSLTCYPSALGVLKQASWRSSRPHSPSTSIREIYYHETLYPTYCWSTRPRPHCYHGGCSGGSPSVWSLVHRVFLDWKYSIIQHIQRTLWH